MTPLQVDDVAKVRAIRESPVSWKKIAQNEMALKNLKKVFILGLSID